MLVRSHSPGASCMVTSHRSRHGSCCGQSRTRRRTKRCPRLDKDVYETKISGKTITLSQRRVPQPSITFSCKDGGVSQPGGVSKPARVSQPRGGGSASHQWQQHVHDSIRSIRLTVALGLNIDQCEKHRLVWVKQRSVGETKGEISYGLLWAWLLQGSGVPNSHFDARLPNLRPHLKEIRLPGESCACVVATNSAAPISKVQRADVTSRLSDVIAVNWQMGNSRHAQKKPCKKGKKTE